MADEIEQFLRDKKNESKAAGDAREADAWDQKLTQHLRNEDAEKKKKK